MKLRELTEKIIKLQRDNGFSDEEMEGLLEWPMSRSWAYWCNNDNWDAEDIERLSELFEWPLSKNISYPIPDFTSSQPSTQKTIDSIKTEAKIEPVSIKREEVLKIVDACFHAYASSYRVDAKEMAERLFDNRGA